jgi:hypothetical protein
MSFLTQTSSFIEVFSRPYAGVWSISFVCSVLFATSIGFILWLKFPNANSTGDTDTGETPAGDTDTGKNSAGDTDSSKNSTGDTDTSKNAESDGRLGLRVLHEDEDLAIEYALIL